LLFKASILELALIVLICSANLSLNFYEFVFTASKSTPSVIKLVAVDRDAASEESKTK
jgi:hypothetical protein